MIRNPEDKDLFSFVRCSFVRSGSLGVRHKTKQKGTENIHPEENRKATPQKPLLPTKAPPRTSEKSLLESAASRRTENQSQDPSDPPDAHSITWIPPRPWLFSKSKSQS
jgi:hypothetical protein